MNETKPWYTSMTMWGGIAMLIVGVANLFGLDLSGERQQVANALGAIGTAIAEVVTAVVVIVGRVRATKQIGAGSVVPVLLIGLVLLGMVGCGGVTVTPEYRVLIEQTAAVQRAIAEDAKAAPTCETCVGRLTRDQAAEALDLSAQSWERIRDAVRGKGSED